MKTALFPAILFLLSVFSFQVQAARVDFNDSTPGYLETEQVQKLEKYLSERYFPQWAEEDTSVEAYYHCTDVPMKVFCSLSWNSEFGVLGSAALSVSDSGKVSILEDHVD